MATSKEKRAGVAATTTEANINTRLHNHPAMSPGQVIAWLDAIARDMTLFPQAVRIAAIVAASCDEAGNAHWTAKRLGGVIGISFKTVQEHTSALRSAGYLAAFAHKGVGTTYAPTMPEGVA